MIKKIECYFLSSYELVDSRSYYLKLSIVLGLILCIFVFLFDPYDNNSAILRYDVPMNLVRIGYGLNLTIVIYILYWIIYRKMGFSNKKRSWKTYHQWLLLFLIYIFAGFSGTVYHRLFFDVGNVDPRHYIFITIPRSILISAVLFTIAVLHDKLNEKNKRIKSLQKYVINDCQTPDMEEACPTRSTLLKSPIVKQSVTIEPQNITYIKAYGNYVEIYLKNEKRARLLRSPLHFVAKQLAPYSYIRKCHRQYYININEVELYKENSDRIVLSIKNSMNMIPVSRKHTKEIFSLVENF